MTTINKKHQCSYCQSSYAKAEHLARHERTHTGAKPFLCTQCKRCFSRQDSLLRHGKRHGHQPLEQAKPKPSPSQMSFAANDIGNAINGPPATNTPEDAQIPFLADDTSLDPFLQLTWPDSEDLLQSILAADLAQLPQSLDVLYSQPVLRDATAPGSNDSSPWIATDGADEGHGGASAVKGLTQMIADLSSNITAEAESTGLTSLFLDGCLHMFFSEFVPSFPIVHRPTFVFREWTHPLLLNAIALGSLFVGQRDNVTKGEKLWRLAHTAVATSWHTLIKHRGPSDTLDGVQLVLTALFGQCYATLSRDITLRKTAQVFHSLGFYWARECGMYLTSEADLFIRLDASEDELQQQWKGWAAREVQLRALLGHYILDGQLAQYTGAPTCQRHASNSLPLPGSDLVFEASTLEDWRTAIMREQPKNLTFRDVFNSLFSPSLHTSHLSSILSVLTIRVVLEGVYSFVSESGGVARTTVGVPSSLDISCALGRLYHCIATSTQMSSIEKSEALLRWHAISLEAATDSGHLCQTLCGQLGIRQQVFGGRKQETPQYEVKQWIHSTHARRALLHAIAIRDVMQTLPLGCAHAIHVPASVFAAATIYAGFLLGGVLSIATPPVRSWEGVMTIDLDFPYPTSSMPNDDASEYMVKRFLHGEEGGGAISGTRNLLYDSNLFLIQLQNLSQPWGISASMHQILEQWLSNCDA